MAIPQLLFPVRSPDREAVPCFAAFRGNGANAPVEVRGRGVTVTRTGTGGYEIDFGHKVSIDNVIGITATHINVGGDNFRLKSGFTGGNVTVLSIEEISDAVADMDDEGWAFITVWVKNAR